MQRSDTEKLFCGMMQACRIASDFRNMTPQKHFFRGFLERFDRIENMSEEYHDTITAAFGALMLHHYNSGEGHVGAKKKRVAKKAKPKRKGKAAPAVPDEDEYSDESDLSDGFTSTDKKAVDAEIDASIDPEAKHAQPKLNIHGTPISFELLLSSHRTFVSLLQPTFLYCRKNTPRAHKQLDYQLMMIVHTCTSIKETTEMLERCRAAIDAKKHELGLTMGYETLEEIQKIRCRVVLIAWGEKYAPIVTRGYHALIKMCAALNMPVESTPKSSASTTTAVIPKSKSITYEFFAIDELQRDPTRGEPDSHVVLDETNIAPDDERTLKHTKVFELRCIERLDMQSRVRDFRVGQTIRVKRKHVLSGGITSEYLQVIDTSES